MEDRPENLICLTCKYVGYGTGGGHDYLPGRTCDYILHKMQKRGCPVGEQCDKYEPKEDDHEPTDLL